MYTKNGVVWSGLDAAWRERLKDTFWSTNSKFNIKESMPENDYLLFSNLKKMLLDFAGEEVCLIFFDPNCHLTQAFSERAEHCSVKDIELNEYLPKSNCHTNAAYLVSCVDPSLHLYYGYYMDKEGMWREHSWCVNPKTGNVVEVTNKGSCYYGINLSNWENEELMFIESNLTSSDIFDINEHIELNSQDEDED